MRLPFLILNPACVALGAACAYGSGFGVSGWQLALILIGAVAAHIAVNALNEYDDFKSGLDFKTVPTPFSGGSGALTRQPRKAHVALYTGIGALVLTSLVGLFFVFIRGIELLPLGLAGLFLIVAYTRVLTKTPFFCLIAPGLGFGPLMVMGTHFVLAGAYTWPAFTASLIPFFLVSDLLLLNQFPDVDADRTIGRRHLPIVIGRRASALVYAFFLACTYLSVVLGWVLNLFPVEALLALATTVAALPAARGALIHADDREALLPYMTLNVIVTIVTPILLAIGLLFGGA